MPKVIIHDRLWQEEEVDASELVFRPSVYGVLVENGKVLLSKQWDGYDWPGGGVDIHETIEQALKREFWEETGLKVEPQQILLADSVFYKNRNGGKWNMVAIYYQCKKIAGDLSIANITGDENNYIDMPEWIDLEEAKKLKFYNSSDNVKLIEEVKKFL